MNLAATATLARRAVPDGYEEEMGA
jgi:hypothetical protein